jgi:hypothetical protein
MADATADFLKWHASLPKAQQDAFNAYVKSTQTGSKPAAPPVPVNSSPVAQTTPQLSPYGKPLTGAYTPAQTEQYRNDPNNQSTINAIRDAAMSRYGSSPDSQVLGLANKVTNEGYPLQVALQMLQQGYGVTDPNVTRAANLMDVKYGTQQSALQRALAQAKSDYDLQTGKANAFQGLADKSLTDIYDALNTALGNNQSALTALYDTGRQQVQDAYAGAQQGVQQGVTGVQQGLADMAAKLGIGDAMPAATQGMNDSLAQFLTSNGAAQAGSVANLATLGTNQLAVGQRGIGDAQKELAQNRTGILNQVAQMLNQAGTDYTSQSKDLSQQLADLANMRGSDMSSTLMDLQDAQTERDRQAALDDLAKQIQLGTLNIQQGQLALSQKELDMTGGQNAFNNSLALAQLDLQRQQLQQQIATASDPMVALQAQAKLQLTLAQIEKTKAGTVNGGKLEGGQVGLNSFYQSIGANPTFQQNVSSIISDAYAQAQNPASLNQAQQDPYMNAMRIADTYKLSRPDLVKQALTIYFKKF